MQLFKALIAKHLPGGVCSWLVREPRNRFVTAPSPHSLPPALQLGVHEGQAPDTEVRLLQGENRSHFESFRTRKDINPMIRTYSHSPFYVPSTPIFSLRILKYSDPDSTLMYGEYNCTYVASALCSSSSSIYWATKIFCNPIQQLFTLAHQTMGL